MVCGVGEWLDRVMSLRTCGKSMMTAWKIQPFMKFWFSQRTFLEVEEVRLSFEGEVVQKRQSPTSCDFPNNNSPNMRKNTSEFESNSFLEETLLELPHVRIFQNERKWFAWLKYHQPYGMNGKYYVKELFLSTPSKQDIKRQPKVCTF
jgi:hypothetical protein